MRPLPLPTGAPPIGPPVSESRLIGYDVATGQEFEWEQPPTMSGGAGVSEGSNLGNDKIPEVFDAAKAFSALTLIADPTPHPWSVNVRLIMTFPDGGTYQGSGVLIDSGHVLTAGHCVHDLNHGGWATSMTIVPAYNNGDEPYGSAVATGYYSWTAWTTSRDFDHDMGVVRLDRPVGALTGWHGYGYNDDDAFFTGTTFNNPGYPGEYPYDGELMYYWYGNFDTAYTYQVRFNNTGYGGQSGSGAYVINASARHVYAVVSHGHGTSVLVDDTRITGSKFGQIGSMITGDTPTTFDLVAMAVETSPASITAGQPLTGMTYKVHNYSSVSYGDTVTVQVYLSTNDLISIYDTLIQTHSFTWTWSPKSTVLVNVPPPTIPSTMATGDYHIGVILDVADYNSGNNDSSYDDASPIHVWGPAWSCNWYCGSNVNMNTYSVATGYDLGGTFQGTVGFYAPNVGAVIAGYVGRFTFPLWGQQGLVNPASAEVMGLPLAIGSSPVTITWWVPSVAAYAGNKVYTQAAAFGGGVIRLTCAYDCTAGF